jgi:hypothetical protein
MSETQAPYSLTVTLPASTVEWAERELELVNAGKDPDTERPLGLDDLIHAALIHAMSTRCHCGQAFALVADLSDGDRAWLRGYLR